MLLRLAVESKMDKKCECAQGDVRQRKRAIFALLCFITKVMQTNKCISTTLGSEGMFNLKAFSTTFPSETRISSSPPPLWTYRHSILGWGKGETWRKGGFERGIFWWCLIFFNTSGCFPRERKLIKQGQMFCRLKGDIIVVFNIRSVASTGIVSIRFVAER